MNADKAKLVAENVARLAEINAVIVAARIVSDLSETVEDEGARKKLAELKDSMKSGSRYAKGYQAELARLLTDEPTMPCDPSRYERSPST